MTRMILARCAVGLDGAALPGKKPIPSRTNSDARVFMEAVLWIARTGAPPPARSPRQLEHRLQTHLRYRLERRRHAVCHTRGTIVKVHRYGGAKGG